MRRALQEVTKEVAGIYVLLTRLLFGGDIPRSLLLHVSLVKPTSALLRFLWLRRMKLQFASRQNQEPLKTHHEAGAVRQNNSGFRIFQRVRPPRRLPQELQRYDPLDDRGNIVMANARRYPRLAEKTKSR
jgi:hypothetical protein